MNQLQLHRLGAANEHMVARALLLKGLDVYWPACQSTHVDILFLRRGRINLVQVKSAHKYRGRLVVRTQAQKYQGLRLDWLGVVDRSGGVWLIPWRQLRGRQTLRVDDKAFNKWRVQ